jgi:hypothetical protein
MSMADNTRKQPDFLTDSLTPKPKDPAGDPLAELARLIGQSDPFAEQVRKPADALRASPAPGSAGPAPGGAGPAPEWLARPAPVQDRDEQDYAARPASHSDYPPDDYADDRANEEPYAPAPSPSYRPLASLFASEGRPEETAAAHEPAAHHQPAARHQQAVPEQQDAYDQDGYESQPYQADDRYRVAPPPAGDYEADSYYDGHIPPQGEDGSASGGSRRGGLITIAAVIGLAVIGTAGAFGYRAFSNSAGPANPPVIKADTTPAKIAVAPVATTASTDASGKPFQDRVGAPPAGERLQSREEQPVALQTAPVRAVAPPLPPAQAAPAAPSPIAAGPEPKKVKVEIIRQNADGTPLGAAAPAARPMAAVPKQQGQPSGGAGPIPITPQADTGARTKTAARTPASGASSGGAYAVQITAQKSEAEAQSAYRAMQAKYPSVLAGRDANIRRADLGGSGVWYRAQVGSFGTFEQATAFCNTFRDAGGQCIVQKN